MPGRDRTLRPLRWALALAGLLALFIAGTYLYVELAYRGHIYSAQAVPPAPLAIVFGAGLGPQGAPSALLAARVRTAVGLYKAGKVQRVLLSGNSERHHDEIGAMRRLAQAQGLPGAALLLDSSGLSTFDTCFRARELFGADHVILVTQRFHMPRALFLANSLGLSADGVITNPGAHVQLESTLRELLARPLALLLVLVQPRHAPPAAAEHPGE